MNLLGQLKIFVIKLIFLGILIFSIDSLIANFIRSKLTSNYINEPCEVYTLLTSATPEILILGASDAHQSYYPQAFIDTFAWSCYNGGISSQGILQNYLIAKAVIDRKPPKIIILNFIPVFFNGFGSNMSKIKPSYFDNADVKNALDSLDFFMPLKQLIPGFKYNSLIINIAESIFRPVPHDKGYYPMPPGNLGKRIKYSYNDDYYKIFDKSKVDVLSKFIQYCLIHKVHLYIIASPEYYILETQHPNLKIVSALCEKYGIPFIDNSQMMVILNNSENFRDNSHLSYIGAPIYSRIVASQIKKIEQQQK